MMKKILWSFRNFINRLSLKNAIQCTGITFGVCALVLTGTIVFANHNAEQENGQGGLETPGMPILTEEAIENINTDNSTFQEELAEDTYNLSYMAYRVRQGDMISVIAENFGVTQDTIISVNNIRSSRLIQIGQYLKIPTMPGIIYTVKKNTETISEIAEKYKVDAVKCAAVNHSGLNNALNVGDMIFVPDAQLDWVTRQEINGDLFRKPIRARWYRSSRFGWRASPFTGVRSYHSGVDMACPHGTSIYAALPGVVVDAGFNSTYGNYVIIRHHSGYKTLYGHMSAILCAKNQYVTQDTRIGKVGNTGLSTGPHLHFTVFKNGKTINPENLWS